MRWLDGRRGRSGSVHAPTVLDNFAQPHGLLAPHITEFDAELRLRRPPHERLLDLDRRSILGDVDRERQLPARLERDRKSTRLNSSLRCISYAVFCLKKKTITHLPHR